MTKKDLSFASVFSVGERTMLAEGLASLLRERSTAYQIASNVAFARGHKPPDVADFGLTDILRLKRLMEPDEPGSPGNDVAAVRLDEPLHGDALCHLSKGR